MLVADPTPFADVLSDSALRELQTVTSGHACKGVTPSELHGELRVLVYVTSVDVVRVLHVRT